MKRLTLVAATAGFIVAMAIPAAAKGATGVTIEGPGIEEAIVVDFGDGSANNMQELVDSTGFWLLTQGIDDMPGYGQLLDKSPTGDFGPQFVLTWDLGNDRVPVDIYPQASVGPLIRVAADAPPTYVDRTSGDVWYLAPLTLLDLLEEYGVPASKLQSMKHPEIAHPKMASFAPAEESATRFAGGDPSIPAVPRGSGSDATSLVLIIAAAGATVLGAWRLRPMRRRRVAPG